MVAAQREQSTDSCHAHKLMGNVHVNKMFKESNANPAKMVSTRKKIRIFLDALVSFNLFISIIIMICRYCCCNPTSTLVL